jgi:hypothetical protein
MRLAPREADMAALVFLGKGRCFWPDCFTKICAFADGKYVSTAYEPISRLPKRTAQDGILTCRTRSVDRHTT